MEILRSIPPLESLRDDWNALADRQGHALLRHEWFLSAAKTLHQAGQLAVVIRATGSRLDAVAPLARTTVGGIERLEFIGADALYEPTGFPARDADARRRLLDEILRLRRPLMLQRLSSSEDVSDLAAATKRRGFLIVRSTTPSLGVALRADGSARVSQPTGKLRSDLKRARARAAEHGEVAIDVVAPGPDTVDATLDAFITIEASGWKREAGSALAVNARIESFFRMYCRLAADAGILRVFFLRVGSALAAAQIAVEVYDRLWLLKIGYDESMAACSPGFLLGAEALAYAQRRGLRSYEFLGGAESWEERWRPEKRSCSLVVFYPWTARGGMSASIDMAGAAWRRLRPEPRQAAEAKA